jgi:arylsulfatase A-like enzyme
MGGAHHPVFARGLALVSALALPSCRAPVAPPAPLWALLTVDTWRFDHWTAARSPNLWALGQQGEAYTNAWSPIGLTTPAHLTMMTGLQPWEHGVEANNHHGFSLPAAVPTLAEQRPGWDSAAFVSAWPAGPEGGLARGFDRFEGPEQGERDGRFAVDAGRAWLEAHRPDQPGLLWVHLYEPHGPYVGDGPDDPSRYAEEVARADTLLGPLIDALVARGATIVVAADHGEILLEETCGRQHERSVGDHVLHVPLLRHRPGISPRVDGGLRSLADVPALLAGEDPPAQPYIIAESGMCEPSCAPGCAPPGIQGRDRVLIGPSGRVGLRPGRGARVEGRPPVDAAEAERLLRALPPVPIPAEPEDAAGLEALGYRPREGGAGR